MAIVINDDCIGCGNCEPECPKGAISQEGEVYVVDEDTCRECGGTIADCPCVPICPTEAFVAA